MVYRFASHTSPGKSRIFALPSKESQQLDAVTTLGSGDIELADDLVDALNAFLAARDESQLATVLDQAPNPVRIAVRSYLHTKCPKVLGSFNRYGPVDVIRQAVYFSRANDELAEYLDAAYVIGLGVRLSNEVGSDGEVGWVLQLLSDEVFVPAGNEPRSWSLPDGIKPLRVWTSYKRVGESVVAAALDVARAASADGKWCRLHTVMHGTGGDKLDGISTSQFVIDVFDAPIPVDLDEEVEDELEFEPRFL